MREKTAKYPHLLDLLQEIKHTEGSIDYESISGCEKITKVLTALNDIVRLCSVLEPTKNPLAQIGDVLRIETPFFRSQNATQIEQLGNLVIVDTPGPNEAGENLRLSAVVAEQLQRSSIVLIVLDFTQLNNEAAEKVKKQVQPIIELIGKDNLYVLVNKVDQRREREGDMCFEQVKKFVYADLNLSDSTQTDRVFEISARHAFTAAKFQWECQQNNHLDLNENANVLKTAEALAQEVLGINWEEELEEITIEDLQKKAQRLWEKSKFAPFLDKAINALMESAAPRCMSSALKLSRNRLLNVRDDLKLRSSAITKDEEKLRTEVDALEADLKRLNLCRTKLSKVDKIQQELQHNLNQILENLKKDSKVTLESFYAQEEYDKANWLEKRGIEAKNIIIWLNKKFQTNINLNSSTKELEFNTKLEAENFTNQVIKLIQERNELKLNDAQKEVESKIYFSQQELINILERESRSIIEKARNRLNQEFEMELSFPDMSSWDSINLNQTQISVNAIKDHQKLVKKKAQDTQRRWYVLWLWEITHEWEEEVNEKYYKVSLETLIATINISITKTVDNIKCKMSQYLDEDFKEKIADYFDCLDRYLCNYRDSLKQAQQAQRLSLKEKNELTQKLKSLEQETNPYIEKVNKYLERTENTMPKQPSN